MVAADVTCVLEPSGLSRSNGKMPNGLTLVPWQRERCVLWDVMYISTFAASHLGIRLGQLVPCQNMPLYNILFYLALDFDFEKTKKNLLKVAYLL